MEIPNITDLSLPYRKRLNAVDVDDLPSTSLAINELILNDPELEHETKMFLSYFMLGYFMGKKNME